MSGSSFRPVSVLLALSVLVFMGADWLRFRGPDAAGVADDTGVPARWSQQENIVWKTLLPGFGASSPITLGNRIFLTCYSGYGLGEEEPGEKADLKHIVVCLNRADGKIIWGKGTKVILPENDYAGFMKLHGYASSTPTTDGQRVYAFFGRSGVFAYTVDGEPVQRVLVGKDEDPRNWGTANSLILHEDLLIVNASVESKSLRALNKITLEEVWRVPDVVDSWSTPLVVTLPDGKAELVVSLKDRVLGIDPASGEQLWHCEGVKDYVVPAVVAQQGIVYVTGGRRPQTMAIRAGGRGDVSQTHLLWEINETPKISTPLYHGGYLYWLSNRGVATCVNAENGEVVYEERMEIEGSGDKIYSSPVLVDGKILHVTREGGTIVLAAGPEFKLLAQNDLGDSSLFNATPVPSNGELLIRSDRYLYCIGN